MTGHGAWTNYETYRVVIDIFEANGCLKQAVDATRENPDYEITAAELFEIADDLFYERIGFNCADSKVVFLAEVRFQEIADYLNIGARMQLGLSV
tara:strand:+ start:289 stop:573 length:285 start_codon:yes stop_codon:yes gene_type:complete